MWTACFFYRLHAISSDFVLFCINTAYCSCFVKNMHIIYFLFQFELVMFNQLNNWYPINIPTAPRMPGNVGGAGNGRWMSEKITPTTRPPVNASNAVFKSIPPYQLSFSSLYRFGRIAARFANSLILCLNNERGTISGMRSFSGRAFKKRPFFKV